MSKLVLIPTPIGNLEDITFRAVKVFQTCDAVLCEDTRTTGNLLRHFGIEKKLIPFHLNNEHKVLKQALSVILQNDLIVLASDAGTPGISDPGFLLVRECIRLNVDVETLPGPTAFVPALVNSGLPCNRFYFEGFLPHKKGRETRLKVLSELNETIILYESPHRLIKLLEEIEKHFGENAGISVSRELTKLHEENFRGTAKNALAHFGSKAIKGEIVVVINRNYPYFTNSISSSASGASPLSD